MYSRFAELDQALTGLSNPGSAALGDIRSAGKQG